MSFEIYRWLFHQRWLTWNRKFHDGLMKGFERHANAGNADAQELFGFLLLHRGSVASSKSSGTRYLMMCASVERPKVCWQLHLVFGRGDILGFAKDAEKEQKYLQLAVQGEHPLAMNKMNAGN